MTSRPDVQVFPDADALARAAADAVVRYVQQAIVTRGRAAVALAGGQTPRPTYRLLAGPPHATRLDFSAIHFFFSDERCVPPDDPRSNYRMAADSLLVPARVPEGNVHRIRGELGARAAADDYRRRLGEFFGRSPVAFDLVLLGVGADGHTASLFAGAAEPPEALVAPAVSPDGVRERVTLTAAAIGAAGQVIFLVSGPDKAAAVAAALEGRPLGGVSADELPAARIARGGGAVRWLLDAPAAGLLSGPPASAP